MSTGTGSTDARTARDTDADATDASSADTSRDIDKASEADAATASPVGDSAAGSTGSADDAATEATDDGAGARQAEGASAPTRGPHPLSAASAEELDDGTPESDADPESDASEADEDEPAPAALVEHSASGSVDEDGAPHRRRRSDPPPAVFNYADDEHERRRDHRRERPRRRGRAGWIATSIVLLLLLGVSVALNWHLWNTTEAWEARADELTTVNYDLGAQLSSEQATTMGLESEIELLSQQLATSNQRVLDLSAESQSAIDESTFASQQIDLLEGHLTTATSTATSLQRCVDGQQQLTQYLKTPDDYDPQELAAFEKSVSELCATAEQNQQRMLAELTE
ncbi:hypothetical protein [Demequina sp. NBRC 110053]|uniref:hypothetical protein n=1 Tax=Demequina sp. NBRC 110053 TaxID=1570342 RepID=UPI0009FD4F14|nr:hypothetical protein [Demequina sp. NBRC 110053]